MRVRKGHIGLGLVGAVGALWVATGLRAAEAEVERVPQCEVAVQVERVPIQEEPVTVPVRHTAPLGEEITAAVPEESKVAVVSVGRAEEDEPNTLRVVLNTGKAVAGEWPLTIRSGETECRGVVRIGTDAK